MSAQCADALKIKIPAMRAERANGRCTMTDWYNKQIPKSRKVMLRDGTDRLFI